MPRRRRSDPSAGIMLLIVLGLIGLVLTYWWVIAAGVIGWCGIKAFMAWSDTESKRQRVRESQILPSVSLSGATRGEESDEVRVGFTTETPGHDRRV